MTLVGSQITGIAGTGQDTETKQHWDWATQWSMPKIETLGPVCSWAVRLSDGHAKRHDGIPSRRLQRRQLLGRRRTRSGHRPLFCSGNEVPTAWIDAIHRRRQLCRVLVTLVALWAMAQSLRRQNSGLHRNATAVYLVLVGILIVSLLLAGAASRPSTNCSIVAVCLDDAKSMQVSRGLFVGAGHSVCLWHPWLEPALFGKFGS